MRFYVATRLDRAAEAKVLAESFEALGYECTYPWWTHGSVQAEGRARWREVGEAERAGVTTADLCVVILPGGRGTHVELGIALGARIPVLLVAARREILMEETCAFYWCKSVHAAVGMSDDQIVRFAEHIVGVGPFDNLRLGSGFGAIVERDVAGTGGLK